MSKPKTHILVCTGGGCVASGALEVSAAFQEALQKHDLADDAKVVETGCLGPCVVGPVAAIFPDNVLYQNLQPENVDEIVEEHILKGRTVDRFIYEPGSVSDTNPAIQEIGFFKKQVKVALRNTGLIDPNEIDEYIARDGYQALGKALTDMTPEQVVEEVKSSGLRGRGGAGFPTGLKWMFTAKAESDVKYVLCNADEGDPGAFMDRSILEGDPHSLIEAMTIAAYAIGAQQGYVYVRAEYPLAVERLEAALKQARDYGLLGDSIMGSSFNFDLEIRMGSGAFVCGEETALITSIEGNRGEPRPRPPFPAVSGLWEKPTLLNNVETYANIPVIIQKGAEWFAAMGTEKSKGTKVFALAGAVNNTGLVEVPIGMPLGEILYDIGGGIRDDKKFKAAQIGGPSGGCIPKQYLNVPVDYESLNELGAIMGSGGLIVMDEDSCMVDMARFFLEFVQEESCGKCPPCRIGTKRMLEILERICAGKGEMEDIDKLIKLGNSIKDTALCGLGQSAPNPVLSTIRHFREEYVAHIRDKHCEAGVCPDLMRSPCQNTCPAGVNAPGYISLIGEERFGEALRLHRERNPLVGVCSRVCFHTCEQKCRRTTVDDAVAIRSLKRFMVEQESEVQLPEIRVSTENAARKVAIVGSGPAGLSCAYFLARLGYRPTVFEALNKPGGMLNQVIPEYRLPRNVIERDVQVIEHLGVTIQTGKRLGKDFTLESLKEDGYQSVFLGVGAPHGAPIKIPGEEATGVMQAIDFLRDYNMQKIKKVGEHVIVIGGGNAAVDAARTALRLGARSVSIAYRRTRVEMPAYVEEIEDAEREGIQIDFLLSPVEVVMQGDKMTGVKFCRMKLGDFDSSGRRRPVTETIEGSEFIMEADQCLLAIGQALKPDTILNGTELGINKWGYVEVDPVTGQTSQPWIFAGGDAVSGPSSVVEAVAHGERAAAGMDQYLTGEFHAFWRQPKVINTFFDPDAEPTDYPRSRPRTIPVAQRARNFMEVELPWSKPAALREASRCLRCDYREEDVA